TGSGVPEFRLVGQTESSPRGPRVRLRIIDRPDRGARANGDEFVVAVLHGVPGAEERGGLHVPFWSEVTDALLDAIHRGMPAQSVGVLDQLAPRLAEVV